MKNTHAWEETRRAGPVLLAVTALAVWALLASSAAQAHDSRTVTVFEGAALEAFGIHGAGGTAEKGASAGPVITSPVPFTRIGFQWDAADSADGRAVLEARVSDDGSAWGEWTEVEAYWQEDLAHDGHLDVSGEAGTAVQLRVSTIGDAQPDALTYVYVEFIEEVIDEQGDAPEAVVATSPEVLTWPEPVNSRASWGARPPTCTSPHTPQRITLHHTVTPTQDPLAPEVRLRQIQNYHMDSLGWCDIGYHYLVTRKAGAQGNNWQGREEYHIGAHVAGYNTNNVGIAYVGTYTADDIDLYQILASTNLMGWLRDHYGIAPSSATIKGHRDYAATECPGSTLYARIPYLITVVQTGRVCGTLLSGVGSARAGLLALAVVFAPVGIAIAWRRRRVRAAARDGRSNRSPGPPTA